MVTITDNITCSHSNTMNGLISKLYISSHIKSVKINYGVKCSIQELVGVWHTLNTS